MNQTNSVENHNTEDKGAVQRTNFFTKWLNRRGLRFNLLFLVVGVSLVVILTLAFILYTLQNRQLVQNAQTGMLLVSSSFETNLQHAMLTRDMEIIDELVQGIAREPRVESLKLINRRAW